MSITLELPDFRDAPNHSYADHNQRYRGNCDGTEHLPQSKLRQEITNNYLASVSQRTRLYKRNRLDRTITKANRIKIPISHSIWTYEEKYFGPDSYIGQGLGDLDMDLLKKNSQRHLKNIRKRPYIVIEGERFKRRKLCPIKEEMNDEEGTLKSGCKLTETCETEDSNESKRSQAKTCESEDMARSNALEKLENCTERSSSESSTLSGKTSTDPERPSDRAEMTEEEDARIRSELYAQKEPDEEVVARQEYHDSKRQDLQDDNDLNAEGNLGAATPDATGELQPIGPGPRPTLMNQDSWELKIENPDDGKRKIERGQLQQRRPTKHSVDDNFEEYLCVRREEIEGWLQFYRWKAEALDRVYIKKQRQEASGLLPNKRKRIRQIEEVFPEDIKSPSTSVRRRSRHKSSRNKFLRRSEATQHTVLLDIIFARNFELVSLLDSTQYPSKLYEDAKTILSQHDVFYKHYLRKRAESLATSSMEKLSTCERRGSVHKMVVHANFQDILVVCIRQVLADPDCLMDFQKWEVMDGLYYDVITQMRKFQEELTNDRQLSQGVESAESQAQDGVSAGLTGETSGRVAENKSSDSEDWSTDSSEDETIIASEDEAPEPPTIAASLTPFEMRKIKTKHHELEVTYLKQVSLRELTTHITMMPRLHSPKAVEGQGAARVVSTCFRGGVTHE